MKTRVALSSLLTVGLLSGGAFVQDRIWPVVQNAAAAGQLASTDQGWILVQVINEFSPQLASAILALLSLLAIWFTPIRKALKAVEEKASRTAPLWLAALLALSLNACIRPPRVDPIEEINTNQTAFVIPLEGENQENQKQFESIEYLEQKKVAAKRITIPQRWRKTGRWDWQGQWIPTVRIITVNRAPVTREWTEEGKGKNSKPITVESKDSIGFAIGVNITAYIDEADTARFLYYYRDTDLATVIDTTLRGEIQNILSEQTGKRTLEECKYQKNDIFAETYKRVVDYAKHYGITISSFGLAEGYTYEDPSVQQAIVDAYVAEMRVVREKQNTLAQKEVNDRNLSIAINERQQAEEFSKAAEARQKQVEAEVTKLEAEALLKMAEKWDGKSVPQWISTGDGNMPVPFLNVGS